jgi:ATP-dependent Clp protease protease subunit
MMAAQQEKIQVCTLACGVAYSAAAGILAMGTKKWRGARPDSAIMLHPASLSLEHDYESNQRALMGFLSKRCEMINRMTATACGMIKKYKKFLSDIDKGLWLSAEEAVKYGVIDTVWCGPLPYVREIENEKTSDK